MKKHWIMIYLESQRITGFIAYIEDGQLKQAQWFYEQCYKWIDPKIKVHIIEAQ